MSTICVLLEHLVISKWKESVLGEPTAQDEVMSIKFASALLHQVKVRSISSVQTVSYSGRTVDSNLVRSFSQTLRPD